MVYKGKVWNYGSQSISELPIDLSQFVSTEYLVSTCDKILFLINWQKPSDTILLFDV